MFASIGIVTLILISLSLIIIAVAYLNMKLGLESVILMGGGLAFGVVGYLLLMRFIDKIRVEREASSLATAVESE